jgi:galactonate dehydratase
MRAWRLKEPVSGRRYTVVRLESRSGTAGFGEGGPTTGSAISEAKPIVTGRLGTDAEFFRHRLAGWPALEAAVNNAALDLLGKTTKTPVYQYLGGPVRYKARLMAHLEPQEEPAFEESVRRAAQSGFKAFTVPIQPRDPMSRIQSYVDSVRQRVERLRAAAGPDSDFVLDGSGAGLTPGDAGAVATALERFHLLFFDEPTTVMTNDALSKITESVTPVGLGRNVHQEGTFQNLLRWQCIDVLRPGTGLNSIHRIRRMAAIAEANYVAIAPYHNGGPIGTVAGIHAGASLANFFIQQVPQPRDQKDRDMRAELTSGNHESAADGFAALINRSGLGIEVNEQALSKYSEETL